MTVPSPDERLLFNQSFWLPCGWFHALVSYQKGFCFAPNFIK